MIVAARLRGRKKDKKAALKMKFENLKFIRLTQPDQFKLIPRELFEQVKGAEFKVDRLYQFGPALLASPLTLFYALADNETSVIKGVLWASINPFTENLDIHVLSIDKDYQGNGALDGALEFLEKIRTENNLNKLQMTTTRPKVYEEKQNWKRSSQIVLEI